MFLSRMLEEKDMLHQAFYEESRKIQRLAREHIRRILDEQEMLNHELEVKRKELDSWSKQLNKREALTERERQKLDEEKEKVFMLEADCYLEHNKKQFIGHGIHGAEKGR